MMPSLRQDISEIVASVLLVFSRILCSALFI